MHFFETLNYRQIKRSFYINSDCNDKNGMANADITY